MKNLIIIILLIGYFSATHCQTFKGTVYDRSTDSTLSFAIIYISGTSVGTYSDINGNFELDISKYSSMPITISLLGYYSVTLHEHRSNRSYEIYLNPKIKVLNEVLVTAKSKRNTYLRIFKREFLGETENAMDCDILNDTDLRFAFYADSGILKAYSTKPILIHNKALGYTITYYLDKFQYQRKISDIGEVLVTSTIIGNCQFRNELLTFSKSEKGIVEDRRNKAYLGSRMHFFRLLYLGNLKQAGMYNILLSDNINNEFVIGSKAIISPNSFVFKKDSLSGYIKNVGILSVTYKWKNTTINIKRDSVYFEKDGYFDPIAVDFSGEMSKQRIGDLLPFEYPDN